MKRVLSLFAVALIAASCATAPAPPSTPPVPAAEPKVVLVSFDGVGWAELQSVAPELGGDGWNRILREGVASRVVPVVPTLTAVTHISIATGAEPRETGVISNSLHRPGGGPDAWMSGFEAPIRTDTIWQAARRAGKRVGAITYPGLDGTEPERTADFGLVYVQPVHRSRIEELDGSDFGPSTSAVDSFSPARSARLAWRWEHEDQKIEQPVDLVAIDTTDDGVANYDDFVVVHAGRAIDVDADRWFALSDDLAEDGSPHLFGSWSRIESFEKDLDRVVVYWGPVSRSVGYPESFRRMIDEQVGFWPGPPDEYHATRWLSERKGISPETFVDQVERFSDFFTRATTVAMARMDWDLLLSYQPVVDETGHQWTLVGAEQQWSTPENIAAAARVRAAAYATFDEAVDRLIDASAGEATLVVVSDHGMMPLHTGVRIGKLLEEWGFVRTERGRVAPTSPWGVFTSGGYAHFHAFGGEALAQRDDLIGRLRTVAYEGEPVFELVRASTAGEPEAMGQVQAYLRPGFAFISGTSGETFEKTRYFGQHGYLAHHRPLHPIFGAWGPAATGQFPDAIEQTSIAGWIARALGIPAPRDAK